MLIYDASAKSPICSGEGLLAYLNGVPTMDAAPGDFKEEDHPRGGKGSEEGGRFVKSEKTKLKEDEEIDDIGDSVVDKDLLDRCDKKLTDEEVIKLRNVASSKKATPDVLKKLAFAERYTSFNANCEIQEAVANNPNTPKDVLKHLTGFPSQNEDYKGKVYRNDVAMAAKETLKHLG